MKTSHSVSAIACAHGPVTVKEYKGRKFTLSEACIVEKGLQTGLHDARRAPTAIPIPKLKNAHPLDQYVLTDGALIEAFDRLRSRL